MKIALPIVATLMGGALAHGNPTPLSPSFEYFKIEAVAKYLASLTPDERARLASKLYYLDSLPEKTEAKVSLFEELLKSGRISNEKNYSTGPRTISCETGDSQ